MTKKDNKIVDLPSNQKISNVLSAIRLMREFTNRFLRMGLSGNEAQKIVDDADQLLKQADILHLPDQFNAAFSGRGWIATSSISLDTMRSALEKHEQGNTDAGEEVLLNWVLDPTTIDIFAIMRSKLFGDVHGRWDQLREALALTKECRYWSAVPLVLIACDGFASDVLGTSPFAEKADLSLFDSMVAHPSSLPTLIAQITKGVRKSSDDELSLPLRHGILHGRSLGYANRMVCGKAWMLMIALVDWAKDKQDEEIRRSQYEAEQSKSWSDIIASAQKLQEDKSAIDAFKPRCWEGPFTGDLNKGEPTFAFREFLTAWKNKNFGQMAHWAVNTTQKSHGYMAGQMRNDAEHVELLEFEILTVSQKNVARAEAHVCMHGQTLNGEVTGKFLLLAFCFKENGEPCMPTDKGFWKVQQKCIFDLMHKKTIDKLDPEVLESVRED